MKTSLIICCASPFIVGLVVSLALANPDMLPKHPGYPMGKSVDPVKGRPSPMIRARRTPRANAHWVRLHHSTMSTRLSIFQ